MKNKLLFLSMLLLAGCGSTGPTHVAKNDPRPCAYNFTKEGSVLSGYLFRTHDILPNESQKSAVEKMTKELAMNGFNIINSDSKMGVINASQTVSFGKGKTVPLNVSVDPYSSGVKVDMSFTLIVGLYTPTDLVKEAFCKALTGVKQR